MIPDPTAPATKPEKRRIVVLKPYQRRHRAWVHAARGQTLTRWIFGVLDREAGHREDITDELSQ